MRIVKPMVAVHTKLDGTDILKRIESLTRVCYKSEGNTTETSHKEFVKRVFQTFKHEGIAEFASVSFTIITDRGVSHELVRHRHASYLQESTRYVNYGTRGMTFILPPWVNLSYCPDKIDFVLTCKDSETVYNKYLSKGWKPQEARYFLPNGIKTQIAATMNLGSLRNFFKKRTVAAAHPQIRQVAVPLLRYVKNILPEIFGDIETPELPYEEADFIEHFGYDELVPTEVYSDLTNN